MTKQLTGWEEFKKGVKKWYHLYELNTYLAMCEPWEKVFINSLFLIIFSIISYSAYAYVPGHLVQILKYLTPAKWWLNDSNSLGIMQLD